MKHFTVGPVELYSEIKDVRSKSWVHFRTKEYGDLVKSVLSKIARLMGNSEENSTIYLAGSGTAAMEAVVENCITKNEKALVINGGGFGHRFCELLKYHDIPYDSINLKWDEELTIKHFDRFDGKNYTTLFVNIHETTSGQLYDKELISSFCRKNGLYLIVDAISSFLADEYDMEKYGIDATIISSQKGLCCSPGLSLVSFSKRMKEKIENTNEPTSSLYFDFKDYLKNITRGQTPYTPPVFVIYEINEMLKLIENSGGINKWVSMVNKKAEYFRKKASDMGFRVAAYPISNLLTPLICEKVSAYDMFLQLKDKYQIYINPCGGELEHKLLRVSHIGNTTLNDIDDLLLKIKEIVRNKMEEDAYVTASEL